MAAKVKVDQIETVDGSGNITINNSVTMAANQTLPAASLTGTLPAISGANLTSLPADSTKLPLAGGTLTGNTTIATNSTPKLILKRTGNNAGNGYIECHGADDSVDYKIAFAQSNGVMSFDVGGTRMLGVTSDGLCFNSDTASTNALDDYEEGTWTPAWDSDSAGSGRVTTVNAARYTKIGNVVHISAYIALATLGTGGSGPLMITGLPFTSVAEYGSGINIHSATGFDDVIGAMSGFRLQNTDARVNIRGNSTANANPYGNNLYWANYAKVGMTMMFTGTYWTQ